MQDKIDRLDHVYVWQLTLEHAFRGISSLIVLFIVLFVRKRREIFFWLIPFLFVIDNVLGMVPAIDLLTSKTKENYDDFAFENWPILLQVANSSFLLAHWVFSVQYLQTALVLPTIFKSNHLKLSLEYFEHRLASPNGAQQFTDTDNLAITSFDN